MPIFAFHEHELKPGVSKDEYERKVNEAVRNLRIPGLLRAYHLKGFKGERKGRHGILWIFESEEAIVENFGTPENPKWPKQWQHYENVVLAPFLDRHPDKINYTDYETLQEIQY